MTRSLTLGIIILLLSCRSHASERRVFHGPISVDQAGVNLAIGEPMAVEGESNRLLITLPSNLHPNYEEMKIVDSTDGESVEFYADVQLNSGRVYVLRAHRLPGMPSNSERILQLLPEDSVHFNGKVVRIVLRSTRPVVVPTVEWQSWNQGI